MSLPISPDVTLVDGSPSGGLGDNTHDSTIRDTFQDDCGSPVREEESGLVARQTVDSVVLASECDVLARCPPATK